MGFPGGSVVKNPPANAGDAEMWVQSLGRKDPQEEEMTTHSSILAWTVPWTEEPGGLQSMGLQRVGHEWATEQQQIANSLCGRNDHNIVKQLYPTKKKETFICSYFIWQLTCILFKMHGLSKTLFLSKVTFIFQKNIW